MAVECSIVFSLLIAALLATGLPPFTRRLIALAFGILLCLTVWVFFQNASIPRLAHHAWSEILPWRPDIRPTISLSPGQDFAALLRCAVPFGSFILTLVLFKEDEHALAVLRLVATAGSALALLSILQFGFAPHALVFSEKKYYLDSLTAPFVNRNTAATFFGLISLVALSMLLETLRRVNFRDILTIAASNRALYASERTKTARLIYHAALFFLPSLALLLTQSRAGVASTCVAFLSLIALNWCAPTRQSHATKPTPHRIQSLIHRVTAALVVFTPLAFFAQRVVHRSNIQGMDDARFCIWPGALAAAQDNFPFGTGLASFAVVFPRYRSADCGLSYYWDKAHNFYLEGLLTLGITFPALLCISVLGLGKAFLKGWRTRSRFGFAGSLGISALVLVCLHASFDFSLQIPGLSIVLGIVLAACSTLCLRPSRSSTQNKIFL